MTLGQIDFLSDVVIKRDKGFQSLVGNYEFKIPQVQNGQHTFRSQNTNNGKISITRFENEQYKVYELED